MSASSSSGGLEFVVIGISIALLLFGTISLVRKGPFSIGGAVTIASLAALAIGSGSVWLIRFTGSTSFASGMALFPTAISLAALVGIVFALLRGRSWAPIHVTIAVTMAAIPVLATVSVVQLLAYCQLDLCINL